MTDPTQPAPAQQPTYGNAPVAGVPYGQPQDAPPYYAAPPAAPNGWDGPNGWGAPAAAPPRSRALGLTALLIAVPLFLLSVIASVVVGMSAGPLASRGTSSFSFNTGDLTPEQAASFAPIGILMGVQMLLGTALGILALVLGIVAVATKRGRPLGIAAICVAVAAPIASFAVYMGALLATLPPA